MSVSLYRASIPVFVRGLEVLSTLLERATDYAAEKELSESDLIKARLFPDMLPLSGQIQFATDTARLSGERLSGIAAPRFDNNEVTIRQLKARIDSSIAYLSGISIADMEKSASRTVTINVDGKPKNFRGDDYLFMFGIQNFFFHVTTAYDILRHKGIPIGKADFLGKYP